MWCTCKPNDGACVDQSSDTNWGPLSELISDRVPKRATLEERNAHATPEDIVEESVWPPHGLIYHCKQMCKTL